MTTGERPDLTTKTSESRPDFEKGAGLVPAVIQHHETGEVLMVGFMSETAYEQTRATRLVTFYSRTRQVLWVKGESSGNFLHVEAIALDCDNDALVVRARPDGPTCHTGSRTCFEELPPLRGATLTELATTIAARHREAPQGSYTASLFREGIDRIVQKIGEEAVEVVIEGKNADDSRLLDEASDLIFHLLVLLEARGLSLTEVEARLRKRMR